MTFLANIPVWVYFIVLALTFMVVHVMALRADQPQNRMRSVGGRVISSLLLLLTLLFFDREDPGSLLIALFGAAVAGFISGRTATPPLPPRREGPADEHDVDSVEAHEGTASEPSDRT